MILGISRFPGYQRPASLKHQEVEFILIGTGTVQRKEDSPTRSEQGSEMHPHGDRCGAAGRASGHTGPYGRPLWRRRPLENPSRYLRELGPSRRRSMKASGWGPRDPLRTSSPLPQGIVLPRQIPSIHRLTRRPESPQRRTSQTGKRASTPEVRSMPGFWGVFAQPVRDLIDFRLLPTENESRISFSCRSRKDDTEFFFLQTITQSPRAIHGRIPQCTGCPFR